MKKGFTLIECLFALSIIGMIIVTSSHLFLNVSKISIQNHSDLPFVIYELSLKVNSASYVEVHDDYLILYSDETSETIQCHENRLVKSPGFVIYLYDVHQVKFSHDSEFIYMYIEKGNLHETFNIGVYFRPQERICEHDDACDVSDDDFFTSNDCQNSE